MKRSLFAGLLLVACVLAILGCGGGAPSMTALGGLSSGNVLQPGAGRVTLTVTWPTTTRLIPQAANSIRATLTLGSATQGTQLLTRPSSGNTSSVAFNNLIIGNLTLTATAFPNADGSGTAQAQGSSPVSVTAGTTTAVSVTMASTINHLELSPASPGVTAGQTAQLTVTAKDNAGAVVLMTPGKLTWDTADHTIATVNATGLASGVKQGATQVSVTDTESLKSVSATLTVQAASPRLLFQRMRDSVNWDIWVMNADGSNQTQLTHGTGSDRVPIWSPDGAKIVFVSNRDGNGEIYVMNADGSNQTRLTNNPADDYIPSWSPDGKHIIFASNRTGNYQIYTMNADGSNQTIVVNQPGDNDQPSWSPDGTKILFQSNRDGQIEVYTMNANGSNQTRVTPVSSGSGNPIWSPDGKKIAFQTDRDGNEEIYVANADGSSQTNVTKNPGYDSDVAWSSDGSKLAFYSERDGNREIYTMNVDGSAQTRLTFTATDEAHPEWSP